MSALPQYSIELTEAVRNLVTEDDEPVDNILSEKQQRLLVDALYESWTPAPDEDAPETPRIFWAAADVAIFRSVHMPPIVPDVFLSLDLSAPPDLRTSEERSYFTWVHGKAPEAVIEIVSNRKGGELSNKFKNYAHLGVIYYAVFDPMHELRTELNGEVLRVFEIGFGKRFRPRDDFRMPELGLALTLWEGRFEDSQNLWLRWCDDQGNLLLTGHEHAAQAEGRAAQAEGRANRLAAKLRELGIEPDQL
jgi:Putative restriction endonuclease